MRASNDHAISRRRALGLASGAAAALGLSACGSGAPESDKPEGKKGGNFVVYWNPGHQYEAYQKVIGEFEKAHGVKVQMQAYQWEDMQTRLRTDFQSGKVPDVLEEPGGWAQEYALSGDALSLQKYVDKDGRKMGFPDDWQEGTLTENTHEGEIYGIQLHFTCSLLMYNKKLLDDAGVQPPTTWDEVVEVGKELTSGKVYGFSLNQDPGYSFPWMLQNGVTEYDVESKEFLAPQDAAIEALQFQADLIHKHKISAVPTPGTDYSGPQKALSANRAAIIVSGPWDLDPIAKSSPDLDLGIAPMPRGKKQSTIAAGTSMFIPAKASRPDISWDFIKRMTTLKTELAATKEARMLMPRKSWGEDAAVQADPHIKAFAEGLAYAEEFRDGTYLTGKSGELTELYKTLYQSIVMQKKPVEQAVDTYLKAAGKLIGG